MDNMMTLNQFLELPNECLKRAEQYDEYSELLRKSVYEQYDAKELKEKIAQKFQQFRDAQFLFKYPAELNIRTTPIYQLREGTPTNTFVSQIERMVEKECDAELWAYKFRNIVLTVATKLTLQEARYFVDFFFGHKPEDIIAEKLGICRKTLQNIKRSCLVKVWVELKVLDEDDY